MIKANNLEVILHQLEALNRALDPLDFTPEGWAVFNCPGADFASAPDDWLTTSVEKLDEEAVFGSDGDALEFIWAKAVAGSWPHAFAWRLNHLTNEVRRVLWGDEWIDSRCGPPTEGDRL